MMGPERLSAPVEGAEQRADNNPSLRNQLSQLKVSVVLKSDLPNSRPSIARMIRPVSRIRPIHLQNTTRIQYIGLRHSSAHGPVYKPPTGYMFNEKVIPLTPPALQTDMIAS